jgi:diguanylate cyclase (GGDEF)-like protein
MHVSFRNRLTFFFILLVILPVLAVATVGILIVRNSEEGKTDERVEQAGRAASEIYGDARERAATIGDTFAADDKVAAAIRTDDRQLLEQRLGQLADREGVIGVRLTTQGKPPIEAGRDDGVAAASFRFKADGKTAGDMVLSATSADEYADLLGRVTGLDTLITSGGEYVAGSLRGASGMIPLSGDVEVAGKKYISTGFVTTGFDGNSLRVRVLMPASQAENAISENTLGIALILLAFLICALAFALTAARSLQSQIDRLLTAAKALGKGDFSVEVPTEGNDEFAALGTEFNSMARQLEARLEELQLERARLQETVRRVGESLGKGLDRDALLGIVVQTAVDGVGAECGRVVMRQDGNGTLAEAARAGNVSSYLAAVQAAEQAALDAGEAAETHISGATALARPLHAPEPEDGILGVISIARPGRPFTDRQRELFAYLTNQAAISIENVDLHETVQRQAVTDELTGLFNHRRFQEVMTAEVERVRRFNQELGLIMFDIDNFKRVNDTYGHLQGDVVLKEVARVLRESSREIDEPARYGGEEMAVALPQTGLEGAYEFAERVRQRIEGLQLPLLEGEGTLRVTASFGVASLPHSAKTDKDALVAAADAALYRAKRSGKNRTVKAE